MLSSGCSDIGGKGSRSCAELSTDAVKYVILLRTENSVSGAVDVHGNVAQESPRGAKEVG